MLLLPGVECCLCLLHLCLSRYVAQRTRQVCRSHCRDVTRCLALRLHLLLLLGLPLLLDLLLLRLPPLRLVLRLHRASVQRRQRVHHGVTHRQHLFVDAVLQQQLVVLALELQQARRQA